MTREELVTSGTHRHIRVSFRSRSVPELGRSPSPEPNRTLDDEGSFRQCPATLQAYRVSKPSSQSRTERLDHSRQIPVPSLCKQTFRKQVEKVVHQHLNSLHMTKLTKRNHRLLLLGSDGLSSSTAEKDQLQTYFERSKRTWYRCVDLAPSIPSDASNLGET